MFAARTRGQRDAAKASSTFLHRSVTSSSTYFVSYWGCCYHQCDVGCIVLYCKKSHHQCAAPCFKWVFLFFLLWKTITLFVVRCKTWPHSWWTLVPSRWPTLRTRWLWPWWCWWWCFLRIIKMILLLRLVFQMAMVSPNRQPQPGCWRKLWEPSKAVCLWCSENQRRIWRVDWYQNLPQVKQVKPCWAYCNIFQLSGQLEYRNHSRQTLKH